ncbi:MAG: DUF2723 domain-containing protein [bacterium]|nr:DUF2723 domain-containing protein [Gammaproteobacteria bacterium]HIL96976.1 DUF2723 domain-containing protein [Pseudomonadales bacterium]
MTTHRVHILAIVTVAVFFYAITMPTTITLEDAGLFQMVCHLDGISHPPGYPLFTLLCNQMTLAPGVVTGNLISVVFALVAVVLFYKVVILITADEFTALVAAIAYAVSFSFWSQAIIIEVYSLAACLFIFCWWLLIKFSQSKDNRYWFCLCLFAGLGLSNHWPLFVLSCLGFVSLLVVVRPQLWTLMHSAAFWLGSGLLFALGLLPYVSLLTNKTPEIALVGAIPLEEFVNYVTRAYYSDDHAGSSPQDKLLYFRWLFMEVGIQFGMLALPFTLVGFYRSVRELKIHHVVSLVVIFLATTFLLMMLMDLKFEIRAQAAFRAYTVIAYAPLALWFSIGLVWLLGHVPERYSRFKLPLAVVLLASIALYNYPKVDRSKLGFVEEYATVVLESLPADAILFLYGDMQIGPFGFLNKVMGVRPDVELYSWHSLVFSNRLSDPLLPKKEMERVVSEFIKNSSRPVFSIDGRQEVDSNYGLYYSYNKASEAPFVFVPELELFIDKVFDLYHGEGWIVDLHEKRFAYDLLMMATRQYVNYGLIHGTDGYNAVRLDRLQKLQSTFPGKLATLETIFLSGAEVEKERLLALGRAAEQQITNQLPAQGISELYQYLGMIHLIAPQNVEAAKKMLKKSLEVMPDRRNQSVCYLRSVFLDNNEVENYNELERQFSFKECPS